MQSACTLHRLHTLQCALFPLYTLHTMVHPEYSTLYTSNTLHNATQCTMHAVHIALHMPHGAQALHFNLFCSPNGPFSMFLGNFHAQKQPKTTSLPTPSDVGTILEKHVSPSHPPIPPSHVHSAPLHGGNRA